MKIIFLSFRFALLFRVTLPVVSQSWKHLIALNQVARGAKVMGLGQDALSGEGERAPLVVNLDGTLIRSDLLVQSAFAHLGQNTAGLAAMTAAIAPATPALKPW